MKKFLSVLGVISGLLVMLIFAGIGGQVGKEVGNEVSKVLLEPKQPTPQEIEAQLIKGMQSVLGDAKSKLPMMLDGDTRIDDVTIGPGARATYHHTFVNYPSSKIDTEWLSSEFRPTVTQKICSNTKMKPSLQYGATYTYSYSGNDGVLVFSFDVNKGECGY
ncbi:hypothetical protein [Desulfogranum marinum]|uniref:hypothetical protein n=1 Tax=Desulfogranum marinum TaxID=453220 RepID=UPI0019654C87|nr:hypothetical protein [Desulfogranum marinum]MBM9515209.1 hypothetical protein [Desulfogranum marinum]